MKAPGIHCYVAGSIPAVTPRYCTKKIEKCSLEHKKNKGKKTGSIIASLSYRFFNIGTVIAFISYSSRNIGIIIASESYALRTGQKQ
jgi:hypothetical protein